MGGFLYIEKPVNGQENEVSTNRFAAEKIMQVRGLARNFSLDRDRFVLHLYGKTRIESDSVLEFEGGGFIATVGTCIYKGQIGKAALRILHEDFERGALSFEALMGHFAVWIYSGGKLVVFNDFRGMYRIRANRDRSVISSSFLAVCETLTKRTPNPQEVFEYLYFDSVYGHDTVIREVEILHRQSIHQLLPTQSSETKKIRLPAFDGARPLSDQALDVHESLSAHFSVLANLFGDSQSLGLTGGYDSRMTLAYFRQAGVTPYLYVQGASDSPDVRVAKMIAEGEGLEIQHDEDEANPHFDIEDFEDRVRTAYFYLDGLPHTGIFGEGAMVSGDRQQTQRPETIRIYGMGGEYFRTTVALRNRSALLSDYLKVEFQRADFSVLGPLFDKQAFLSRFAGKIKDSLKIESNVISRSQMELAYRDFRLANGAGTQMTLQNERAFAIVPFAEPIYAHFSAAIPVSNRLNARFQSELIKLVDPKLASYPMEYGYSLADGPGIKTKIKSQIKQRFPISIRPFIYRHFVRAKGDGQMPFYLSKEFLNALFPDGCSHVSPYIDIDKVSNSRLLSRALTLELILSGRFKESGLSKARSV
jgi:hypothetical protein